MRDLAHGTVTEYRKYACRCEECRAAQRESMRVYRTRAQSDPTTVVPHGTLHGYNTYNCRCLPCTLTKQEANRRYRSGAP